MKLRYLPLLLSLCCGSLRAAEPAPITHFTHGLWFNGTTFVPNDFYAENGILTHKPSRPTDITTVDLHGGYIVPPYGDAHEHNFDGLSGMPALTTEYLGDGIFYAQGMADTTGGANEVLKAHLVNTPQTVDVTYAHGCLTGINGHPKEIYESIANGFWYPASEAQRQQVIASHLQEGHAYWEIETLADLDAKWPRILAAKPQLIKIILSKSEDYANNKDQLGNGLNPDLVGPIVTRAHAAGLKVAAHIDTPADFHVSLINGVDEMGHMPGYGIGAHDKIADYRLSDADIQLAAKHHIKVQATAGLGVTDQTPAADLEPRKHSQIDNLTRLKAAGVPILIGSDRYGMDSLHEADYLQSLGVWSNLEMLRMWSITTPQTIFPKRKIAALEPGYEASFLVLAADPLKDWSATHTITDRWKQGEHIVITKPQAPQ